MSESSPSFMSIILFLSTVLVPSLGVLVHFTFSLFNVLVTGDTP